MQDDVDTHQCSSEQSVDWISAEGVARESAPESAEDRRSLPGSLEKEVLLEDIEGSAILRVLVQRLAMTV